MIVKQKNVIFRIHQLKSNFLSMDEQSKFEEKVKKHRRYSNLFEPLTLEKHERTRRASISVMEVNYKKEKDISEPNLKKADFVKTLRSRSVYFSRDLGAGDQVTPKLIHFEKIESESKRPKNKTQPSKNVKKKENVSKNPTKTEKKIPIIINEKKSKKLKKNIKPKELKPIDQEILKIYTDKTVKKFNNLETIFESPSGSFVMGKRKLKRYLNFDNTNSFVKKTQRKAKAKKINPSFNSNFIEKLPLRDVDDFIKITD